MQAMNSSIRLTCVQMESLIAQNLSLTTENLFNFAFFQVVCPVDRRFLLLFTFLKRNLKKKKIMVFFSSCNSVKFHGELLNYVDIPCLDIHGRQKQAKRTKTFFEFCNATTGILLCTDVAARGLDIPQVDWYVVIYKRLSRLRTVLDE